MASLMNESDEEINELNQILDEEIGSLNNFTLNGEWTCLILSLIVTNTIRIKNAHC